MNIKLIDYIKISDSLDVIYIGWTEDELAAYANNYQSKFYGNAHDARFEITDNEEDIYYAIFRTAAENEWVVKKTKDYLLFKDQNRLLLNIGGKLYRYLINERRVLNNSCYDRIITNDYGKANSPYFHSLSSFENEIMIVVDREGIAAINWDMILWKHDFEWSYCGYLELLSLSGDQVIAKYYDPSESEIYLLSFAIKTGTMVKNSMMDKK